MPKTMPNSTHLSPEETTQEESGAKVHDSGLLAIAIFKLTKCLFFFSLGVGAVHFLHKDLGDAALRLATALRQIGFATFGYSAVALTEGIGLLLERTWAEYLTLILTVSFVPWELFELVMRPSIVRVAIFVMNLAVLWYLVWLLQRKGTLKPLRARTST